MELINALGISREYACKHVQSGDKVVDATAGHGRDTLLLSKLVGENGFVYSFDIQDEALESTKQLIESVDKSSNVMLIKDNHENMEKYVEPGISCVMFNLGYLPGGDHSIHTRPDSSIAAIDTAAGLLKSKGLILIVIYHGGDTGFTERDRVIEYCSSLDQKKFTVEMISFINQQGNPPILICIQKD